MRRLAVLLSVGALVGVPVAAAAVPITVGFSGSYEEDGGFGGNTPDLYSISNSASSETQIVQIVLDLSGSLANFDPVGSPFADLGSDPVGFSGTFSNPDNQTLTLTFSDFDPGEVFNFGVETDDSGGSFTTGADFAGSIATVTFLNVTDPASSGTYTVDPGNSNAALVSYNGTVEAVPEPGIALLLGLGLAGLAGGRVRS